MVGGDVDVTKHCDVFIMRNVVQDRPGIVRSRSAEVSNHTSSQKVRPSCFGAIMFFLVRRGELFCVVCGSCSFRALRALLLLTTHLHRCCLASAFCIRCQLGVGDFIFLVPWLPMDPWLRTATVTNGDGRICMHHAPWKQLRKSPSNQNKHLDIFLFASYSHDSTETRGSNTTSLILQYSSSSSRIYVDC